MRAFFAIFASEIKRTLTYRVEFWAGNFIQASVHLWVAFSLWAAIFAQRSETIGGYDFETMIFYYVVSSCLYYIICPGEMGFISTEIYEGQLNRYLVYPVAYLPMKFAVSIAQSTLYALQFLVALLIFRLFIGAIPFAGWFAVLGGLGACIVATGVAFLVIALLQLAAFWLDECWTLVVMFYMLLNFLGGRTLPLSVLPAALQSSLRWTPFPLVIGFPTEAFLGRLTAAQLVEGYAKGIVWIGILSFIVAWVYRKGLKRYGGVGI